MKNLIIAFVLMISSTFALGQKNFIDTNFIEVTGKAEMEITPDMIYLKVLLNEKDTKNKISVSDLEAKMVAKLKEIGIDITKNLLIKDFSSNYKFYALSKREILLTKEYQILVNDAKTASKVLIGLEDIGISNVSIDRVDHSKMEDFRREVKVNAIKAAKEKAESLTSAIGQTIGKAIFIQEIEPRVGYAPVASNTIMIRGMSSMSGLNTNSQSLDVDFEKIEIEYSILCKFELK